MEKIRQLIKHNTALKIISVCIAFILWVAAYNVSNPEVTETVTAAISVLNENELTGVGKTYTMDSTSARVSYRIRSQNRRQISSDDFNVYIDLMDYSVTGAVPVYCDVSEDAAGYISSVSVSPIVVHIETEDMVEKSFTLNAAVTGSPAEDKAAGSIKLSTESLKLYGPASEIGRIAKITAEVSIEGAEEDVTGKIDPICYDSNDNVIKLGDETRVLNTISYTVPIYDTKKLTISAQYSGEPAAGYILNSFTVDPSYITVYGPDDILSQYTSVTIPANQVDIQGATSNVAVLLDITEFVPEGLYISGSSDVSIVASVSRSSVPSDMGNPGDGGGREGNLDGPGTAVTSEDAAESPGEETEPETEKETVTEEIYTGIEEIGNSQGTEETPEETEAETSQVINAYLETAQ